MDIFFISRSLELQYKLIVLGIFCNVYCMVDVVLVSQACIVFIVDLVEVLQCANVSSNRAEGGRKNNEKLSDK